MNTFNLHKSSLVALLILGSATLLISCGEEKKSSNTLVDKSIMTQRSDSLVLKQSENGLLKYRFETPLLERYDMADEPYIEFRQGVDVVTFDEDGAESSTMRADYAIFHENKKLWEAKGGVVVANVSGQTLKTEQLFWDQATKKIYSHVESTVVDGPNTIVGEEFEADEEFKEYTFKKPKGKVLVDATPTVAADSISQDSVGMDNLN